MEQVYFLLGSNLGDRKGFLEEATRQLQQTIGCLLRSSSIYETQSWGVADLPDYLNQVVEMETNLQPAAILKKTKNIEENLCRERTKKWYSRTIDIDILFFGNSIINLPELKIPHPELQNRLFTLEPLDELIPNFIHPVFKKKIHELRQNVEDRLLVTKYTRFD